MDTLMPEQSAADPLLSLDLDGQFNSFLDAWIGAPDPLFDMNTDIGMAPQTQPLQAPPLPQGGQELPTALPYSFTCGPGNPPLGPFVATTQPESASRMSSDSIEAEKPAQTSSTDKKTRVLEKNRRAQKRFREKQKTKMHDMEAQRKDVEKQIADLRSTLNAMTANTTSLERQNEVLNKVLELREHQIEVLRETLPSLDGPDPEQMERLESCSQGSAPIELCRSQTNAEVIATWKGYVERMATKLLIVEAPGASEAAQAELAVAIDEALTWAQTLSIVNQVGMKHLVMCNLETEQWDEGRREDVAPLESIHLSDEQKESILHLARMLQTGVRRLGDERERLATILNDILPLTFGSSRCLGACIRAKETMERMQKNFEAEHTEWSNYHAGVLGKVMSGLQLARFCTASYPMFPNGFNIVKHIIASGYQSSSTTLAPFVLTLETLPLPTHIKKLQLCDTQQP